MRSGVFVNYRGSDSSSYAALLHFVLSAEFGEGSVFLDSVSIPPGTDFVAELMGRVRGADVVLAVIGPRWLAASGEDGRRRIDDPGDWIRRELAEAFAAGVRVIPVLVDDAAMPAEADLPADIAALGRCQFVRLRHRDARADLARLVSSLTSLVARSDTASSSLLVDVGSAAGGDADRAIGEPAQSVYLQQVRRIAPEALLDRDEEMAELAAFSTQVEGPSYAWWRAPAWAGKSALLSWFVLHPPPQTILASFFVTARFAGQGNRQAFIDVMLEQLAHLLGQPPPAYAGEATREGHLSALLSQAAEAARRSGRRLVLVVDGLDEDRGVTADAAAHSIAALLPSRPPAGMRVVVTGRPEPSIPADVPDDHPLRDPSVVRALAPSARAAVVRVDAERELIHLLRGTPLQQDILGLVVAAGGGLCGSDLAELAGRPLWEIDDEMRAVTGRTFSRRSVRDATGRTSDGFLLAHQELQAMAERRLGEPILAGHRQRLHAWAEVYRGRHWPADTPAYLLTGYHHLLLAAGDRRRAMECALGADRHDRMRALTGGDAAALAEIAATADQLVGDDDPDLYALSWLAIHAEQLAGRSAAIPRKLPGVWARLGRPERAQALADAITDPYHHPEALAGLAAGIAAAGDLDRGEAIARSIRDPNIRDHAYDAIVRGLLTAGDLDRAATLAALIDNPHQRATALRYLADAAARAGQVDRALALVLAAPRDGPALGNVTRLLQILAVAGEHARALDLIQLLVDSTDRQWATACFAAELARAGNVEDAHYLLDALTHPEPRVTALSELAQTLLANHDRAGATTLIRLAEACLAHIEVLDRRLAALGSITKVATDLGDEEVIQNLAAHTRTAADLAVSQNLPVTSSLTDLLVALGMPGRALQLASSTSDTPVRAHTLTGIAIHLATSCDFDRAEGIVRSIDDSHQQINALHNLADALAAQGQIGRADALIASMDGPSEQDHARLNLARTALNRGDPQRAEALAHAITEPHTRAEAFTELADTSAGLEPDQAATWAEHAETAARSVSMPDPHHRIRVEMARVFATAGDFIRAEALARGIPTAFEQGMALLEVVTAVASSGDLSRAEAIALTIAEPGHLATALTNLAQLHIAAEAPERADTLMNTIADPQLRLYGYCQLAHAQSGAGNQQHADALLTLAHAAVGSITDPERHTLAIAGLASAAARIGDLGQATTLAAQCTSKAHTIRDTGMWSWQLSDLCAALAGAGGLTHAETIARSITDPQRRAATLSAAAHAAATNGHIEVAQNWAESITPAQERIRTLCSLAQVHTDRGNLEQATALLDQAEATAHSDLTWRHQAAALHTICDTAATLGDFDRAETVAQSIADPHTRDSAISLIATKTAAAGHLHRAEILIRTTTKPHNHARALLNIANTIIDTDPAHADALATQAEHLAPALTTPQDQAEILINLIRIYIRLRDPDHAQHLVQSIPYPSYQAGALLEIAKHQTPKNSRHLIARALRLHSFSNAIPALIHTQPDVINHIANSLLDKQPQHK